MQLMIAILALLGMAFAVVALVTFVAVTMSKSGRRHSSSGSLGNAMLEMQSMIEPGKKKVIEARKKLAESEESDESGDPPLP